VDGSDPGCKQTGDNAICDGISEAVDLVAVAEAGGAEMQMNAANIGPSTSDTTPALSLRRSLCANHRCNRRFRVGDSARLRTGAFAADERHRRVQGSGEEHVAKHGVPEPALGGRVRDTDEHRSPAT
jgi:hypothetical protein